MNQIAPKIFTRAPTADVAHKLEQALASCRVTLRQKPRDAGCLYAMGLIECQLGRPAEAEKWLKRALVIQGDSIDFLFHYGLTLMEQAKYAPAITTFRRVISLNAGFVDAYYHLGYALRELGETVESENTYRQMLVLKPDHAGALNNLGNIVTRKGDLQEAIELYQRAIAAKPDYAIAFNNLGLALATLGALPEAEEHYRRAIALNPLYAEAHNNLGIVMRLVGDLPQSMALYQRALQLRPIYPEAINNLGNACKDCGRLDDAMTLYRQAIALQDSADNRHNLALTLLAMGRYSEGWELYEARWQGAQLASSRRDFAQPLWKGEEGAGRTLLIHAEQGFGDTLQFCRYATLAAAKGFRVVVEVQPPLVRLLQNLPGVEAVIGRGEVLPDFDMHCPMLSLPRAFDTQVDTIPAHDAYVTVDAAAIQAWVDRLPERGAAKWRVGLVWAGNPRKYAPDLAAVDRRRSMAVEMLRPLLDVDGVQFFTLQKTDADVPADFGLVDVMKECHDFADTAALIAHLDLVISVDTAVAHLAAAMGKPVWLLNRFDSCWRWFQNRSDSPWYPSVRLFRQPQPGDWQAVITAVRAALEQSVLEIK